MLPSKNNSKIKPRWGNKRQIYISRKNSMPGNQPTKRVNKNNASIQTTNTTVTDTDTNIPASTWYTWYENRVQE